MNNNGCRYDALNNSKNKHQLENYDNLNPSFKSKSAFIISIISFVIIMTIGIIDTFIPFLLKIEKTMLSLIVWLIIASFITYFINYLIIYLLKKKKEDNNY